MGNRVEIWVCEVHDGRPNPETAIPLWAHWLGPYLMEREELENLARYAYECVNVYGHPQLHWLTYSPDVAAILVSYPVACDIIEGDGKPRRPDIRPRGYIRDVNTYSYVILLEELRGSVNGYETTIGARWTIRLYRARDLRTPAERFEDLNLDAEPVAVAVIEFKHDGYEVRIVRPLPEDA